MARLTNMCLGLFMLSAEVSYSLVAPSSGSPSASKVPPPRSATETRVLEDPTVIEESTAVFIFHAAGEGRSDVLADMMCIGHCLDVPCGPYRRTPLWHAASKGKARACLTLLGAGARPDTQDRYGATALSAAAEEGHTSAVVALLSYGARIDLADEDGFTPISLAEANGHDDVLAILLEQQARNAGNRAKRAKKSIKGAAAP